MNLTQSGVLEINDYKTTLNGSEKEWSPSKLPKSHYLKKILEISEPYLEKELSKVEIQEFYQTIKHIQSIKETKIIVEEFSSKYIEFIKLIRQRKYEYGEKELNDFVKDDTSKLKIVWGDACSTLEKLDSESIHLMVTSPPYYNARDYSIWKDISEYFIDMRMIIQEAYRVLDNHRVFVFNVGDIFDNDNLTTTSVWGKRRLPLGAYFIKLFEEIGFTFIDDIIWDKGEVQSERHKNGDKNYPFYQYPMNCYEHLLIFHKHRLDKTRFPCPVCGCLKVNGNTQSEIGLQTWECKNEECFTRSKSNRGKRFSLKNIKTQAGHSEQNEISKKLIKKWRRDIIKFSPVIKINSKGENTLGHTAPFPEEIPEMAINFFSYPNEIVLDPFAGSFTTAIVANHLDRIGVGIELNKERFRDSIINNIANKLGLFENNISEYDPRRSR